MERIKQKRRRFNALLACTHTMNAKQQILSSFGARSTLDLNESTLDLAISRLEKLMKEKQTDATKEIRTWRHRCLKMIKECGVNTNDWNAVNDFMLNPRICGKLLTELTVEGLKNLHRKLHNVSNNIAEKDKVIERLTKLN